MSVNYIMMVGKIGKDRLTSVFKMQRFFCLYLSSIEEKRVCNKIGD